MGFDRTALQNIRIDGPLCEEFNSVELAGLFLENADKLRTDDFPLGLRICDSRQFVQETVDRVDIYQVRFHLIAEDLNHLLRLSLAQETVVDMYAGQLLSDRLDQEGGDDGRIHTA